MVFEIDCPVKPNINLLDHIRADSLRAWGNGCAIGWGNLFIICGIAIVFIMETYHL
jgi:hypothetical protein